MLPRASKNVPKILSTISARSVFGAGGQDPTRPPPSSAYRQDPFKAGQRQGQLERDQQKFYDPNVDRNRNLEADRERSSGPSMLNPFEVVKKTVDTVNETVFGGSRQPQSPTKEATIQPSYRPFVDVEHPVDTEIYRLKNPIVEENGVKKFKLEFDMRRFDQNDVKINTNAKECCMVIEAKKCDKYSKMEFYRKVTIPEGVKPHEITCDFKSDGVLVIEAPYYEPAKFEGRQDTKMEINRE